MAAQVQDNVREYSKYVDIKSAVVFGGVNAKPQIATLRSGVDILVATPGRLLDLHDRKALSFKRIEVLILDDINKYEHYRGSILKTAKTLLFQNNLSKMYLILTLL